MNSGAYVSVDETIVGATLQGGTMQVGWVSRLGCNPAGTTTSLAGHSRDTYTACRDGATVSRLRVLGAGHTWPGGNQYPRCRSHRHRRGRVLGFAAHRRFLPQHSRPLDSVASDCRRRLALACPSHLLYRQLTMTALSPEHREIKAQLVDVLRDPARLADDTGMHTLVNDLLLTRIPKLEEERFVLVVPVSSITANRPS